MFYDASEMLKSRFDTKVIAAASSTVLSVLVPPLPSGLPFHLFSIFSYHFRDTIYGIVDEIFQNRFSTDSPKGCSFEDLLGEECESLSSIWSDKGFSVEGVFVEVGFLGCQRKLLLITFFITAK